MRPAALVNSAMPNFDALMSLVSHTPLLTIHYRFNGQPRRLFAKYEAPNFTGSIKDRMAAWILRRAYETHELEPGMTIAEASSGNTGISFAALGRALGHKVRIYMPNWMSEERKALIRAYGAEIVLVSHEQGGFLGSIRMTQEFAASGTERVYLPRQFDCEANCEAHYNSTGPEIEAQLALLGLRADAFVAGVGTGGTVMGVGRFLRRERKVRVHPLEPAESPTLRVGRKVGKHRIQGISDEFVPSICKLDELDEVIDVADGDSILMAQALGSVLGLGVGISSGANFLGAAKLVEEMGKDAVVVTVLSDSSKKYLSTDLCRTEPVRDDYLTPHVELESINAVRCALMQGAPSVWPVIKSA